MENNVVSEYLLALEIDGVIAENPPGVYMALS